MSSGFVVSYVLLWVLVVGQSVLVFVLLRTLGQVLYSSRFRPSDDGIPIGERLPDLELVTLDGAVRLESLLVRPFNVFVLAQVNCEYCTGAVRAAEALKARSPAFGAQVVVGAEEIEQYSELTDLSVAGIDRGRIRRDLKIEVTPFVFLTDRSGIVLGKGVVNDAAQLEALVATAGDDVRAALADAEAHANDAQTVPTASAL